MLKILGIIYLIIYIVGLFLGIDQTLFGVNLYNYNNKYYNIPKYYIIKWFIIVASKED